MINRLYNTNRKTINYNIKKNNISLRSYVLIYVFILPIYTDLNKTNPLPPKKSFIIVSYYQQPLYIFTNNLILMVCKQFT